MLGTSLIPGHCHHCQGSMLIHDGSTGEVTCQMCARSWSCDTSASGHEHCAVQPTAPTARREREPMRRPWRP
jgi:hypothetical protein